MIAGRPSIKQAPSRILSDERSISPRAIGSMRPQGGWRETPPRSLDTQRILRLCYGVPFIRKERIDHWYVIGLERGDHLIGLGSLDPHIIRPRHDEERLLDAPCLEQGRPFPDEGSSRFGLGVERAPEEVRRDLDNGMISEEAARGTYNRSTEPRERSSI
jgi:hypothetical protein